MALLELKGFGVSLGATQVAGIDMVVEPQTMLAVVGRGDGAVSLLALAVAGLAPRGAVTQGSSTFTGKRVLYLDHNADASAVVPGPELIVADEPGRGRDPATQFELLQALQRAGGTAAVLIFTADFRLALSMGLEVAVIANGKLLLKTSASQIAELPQYDTVRHLVGGARIRTRTLMRPPIGEPMLELDGVSKTYRHGLPRLGPPPVVALAGIGFAVRQGEVVGVLGPSGAGKSTLLRLIAGLETPSAGHIGRRQGLVGYVFSDPRRAFNPTLPVGMSLTEPLRVEQTLLVEEQADRLVEVVRAVGLEPDLLARLPAEFGVADLQRMALARALAGRPNLLLMDDPTAYLDPAELREFLVLFARVRADFGLTAIVTSREFEVLRGVADRLLVLDGGHIVEGGKPAELSEAPKREITRRLASVRYPGRFVAPVVVEAEAVPEPAVATVVPEAVAQLAAELALVEASTATVEAVAVVAIAEPVGVPSTELPADGFDPNTPGALAPAAEQMTTTAPQIGAKAEPEPPVHGLSAEIVIAPVVLPEPAPVVVTEATAPLELAEPAAPRADLASALAEPAPRLEVEPAAEAPEPQQTAVPVPDAGAGAEMVVGEIPSVPVMPPEEPVPGPVEPISEQEAGPVSAPAPEPSVEAERPLLAETVAAIAAETAVEEVSAGPEMAEAAPVLAPPDLLPTPDPATPLPEPQAAEPAPALSDRADEAGKGGEVEGAVEGLVDTAGGADAPDGKSGR